MSLPPLIDGPGEGQSETTPPASHEIISIGHYSLPDDIEVVMAPLFKQLEISSKSQDVERTVATSEPIIVETVILPVESPNISDESGNEGGVVGLSVSVVVLMIGTVMFSTLLASLVAVLVAKVTSNKQKESNQVEHACTFYMYMYV